MHFILPLTAMTVGFICSIFCWKNDKYNLKDFYMRYLKAQLVQKD